MIQELSMICDGYCPESKLKGKQVKMRQNRHDSFESEETGLQIRVYHGLQAVILNKRGKGNFTTTPRYAHESTEGEPFYGQLKDKSPMERPVQAFKDLEELKAYINSIE
ncbi:MAG: hypothetical protein LAT67_13780 [Balneolales bacterium]|nr:hypothetical protein [Balneolales bacterium]